MTFATLKVMRTSLSTFCPVKAQPNVNRAILNIVNVALLTQVDTDDYLADRD